MNNQENKLYQIFEVESEEELLEFIKNNPDDQRVIDLLNLQEKFNNGELGNVEE